jgi:hypothetical protein
MPYDPAGECEKSRQLTHPSYAKGGAPSKYVAAGQISHSVCAMSVVNVPSTQAMHVLALECAYPWMQSHFVWEGSVLEWIWHSRQSEDALAASPG